MGQHALQLWWLVNCQHAWERPAESRQCGSGRERLTNGGSLLEPEKKNRKEGFQLIFLGVSLHLLCFGGVLDVFLRESIGCLFLPGASCVHLRCGLLVSRQTPLPVARAISLLAERFQPPALALWPSLRRSFDFLSRILLHPGKDWHETSPWVQASYGVLRVSSIQTDVLRSSPSDSSNTQY